MNDNLSRTRPSERQARPCPGVTNCWVARSSMAFFHANKFSSSKANSTEISVCLVRAITPSKQLFNNADTNNSSHVRPF